MEATNKQKGIDGSMNTKVQPQSGAMPEKKDPAEGDKMAIFKKWWFWAAVGGVVLLLVLVFLFLL